MAEPPDKEGEEEKQEEGEVVEIKDEEDKLACLAPVAGEDENLLDFINKFQGDVPHTDQEQESEEEMLSMARMSIKETTEQQMFVPFDPFAPITGENKLTSIEELANDMETVSDGYYTPPPPSVPSKSILTGSNDPLMPDSRPPIKEKNRKEVGQMAPEDLEMRAPYIPMEEDFELGAGSNEMTTPFSSGLGETWVPVDPFGQNAKRLENRSRSLCSSPFSPQSLTPPQLSTPLDSPIHSPKPVSSPLPSPGANIQGGGKLTNNLSRSLTNLTVPQMNYMPSSPQPVSYGRMPLSPVIQDKGITSPQLSPSLPSPRKQLAPPASTQTLMIHTQISPTLLVMNPTCPNAHKVVDTNTKPMPGLMSMLKRKSTGSSNEPGGKARKGCSGMRIHTKAPAIRKPASNTGHGFTQDSTSSSGLSNFLLQPQHLVSGIGDSGSFAQFLHRFALNVSNQNGGDGNGKAGPTDGASLMQLNPTGNLEPIKKTSRPPDGIQRRDSLPLIDCQDAEVNAPVMLCGGLLQGADLLNALDQTINRVPSQTDLEKYQ